MKLAEFFIDLVVNAAGGEMTVNGLVSSFGQLEVAGLGGIGMLTTFARKLADLTDQAMNTAQVFQMFETQTGRSAMGLQQWQLIAEQANVSADAVRNSILALERGMAEIRMGRGNVAPFQILGVNPSGKDAFQVITELRQALKSVPDQATKVNLLQQMGIDPTMLQMLELTNQEMAEFAQTSTGMTQTQEKQFLRLRLSLVQFQQTLREAGYATASFFGPVTQSLLNDAIALMHFLGSGVAFVRSEFEKAPGAIRLMAAAVAVLAAAFFPITTAVGALILLMDDLVKYFQGKNSVIGWLEKQGTTAKGGILDKIATSAMVSAGVNPALASGIMNSQLGQRLITAPMYNTFHVTGGEYSAKKIADTVISLLQRQVNHADTMINNGPKK